VRDGGGFTAYERWAAAVTMFFYTAGYSTIGFGLLFLGALWRLVRHRSFPWQATPLDLPMGCFAGVLLLSAAFSPYRSTGLLHIPLLDAELPLPVVVTAALLMSGAVYYGSFAWLLQHDGRSRLLLVRAWALGAVPAAVTGFVSAAARHARAEIPRGVGPNGLGTTLLLGSLLTAWLIVRTEGRARFLWAAAGAVSLLALLATESRASLVGWTVGIVYLAWRELRLAPRQKTAAVAGGLALLVLAAAVTPQLRARLGDTVQDVSGNRLRIWRTSVGMIAEHPYLGTGFGTFETAYEAKKDPKMSPEPFAFNLWLNLAVETGLLGLAAVLWIAGTAVREWMRAEDRFTDPLRTVIGALWIGLLVDQFADNTLFSISTSAGLWLLLALLVVPRPIRTAR
jgi:O-antigen ligase